jgi:hypothetical protein
MRAKKDNGSDTAAIPFTAVAVLNGNVSSALMEAQAACARGSDSLREELVRFTSDRLNGTGRTLQDLAQCRSPAEAIGLQQQWLMGMGRDYLEESMRLFKLAGEIAQASLKPMGEAARQDRPNGGEPG